MPTYMEAARLVAWHQRGGIDALAHFFENQRRRQQSNSKQANSGQQESTQPYHLHTAYSSRGDDPCVIVMVMARCRAHAGGSAPRAVAIEQATQPRAQLQEHASQSTRGRHLHAGAQSDVLFGSFRCKQQGLTCGTALHAIMMCRQRSLTQCARALSGQYLCSMLGLLSMRLAQMCTCMFSRTYLA